MKLVNLARLIKRKQIIRNNKGDSIHILQTFKYNKRILWQLYADKFHNMDKMYKFLDKKE